MEKNNVIMLTAKSQRQIIDFLPKASFNLNILKFSKVVDVPFTTLYDAWKNICKNNKVEIVALINGVETAQLMVKSDPVVKRKKREIKW